MEKKPPIVEYAIPQPSERWPADRLLMFFFLLPTGIFAAEWAATLVISNLRQDDQGAYAPICLMLPTAPLSLGCGVAAKVEATRKDGLKALFHGVCWNLLLVGVFWLALQFFVRYRWGR